MPLVHLSNQTYHVFIFKNVSLMSNKILKYLFRCVIFKHILDTCTCMRKTPKFGKHEEHLALFRRLIYVYGSLRTSIAQNEFTPSVDGALEPYIFSILQRKIILSLLYIFSNSMRHFFIGLCLNKRLGMRFWMSRN